MRAAATVGGLALLWLGAGLGALVFGGETCAWGDPDGLHLGLPVLAAFLAGTALLGWSRPPWFAWLALLPPALPYAEQASFGLRLALDTLDGAASACAVLTGRPQEPSGEEAYLALLWLAVALVPPLGIARALLGRRPAPA